MANQEDEKVNPVQVQKYLGGIDYPVNKQAILKVAKDHGADERVMKLLQKLPDRDYDAPTAVTKEIGKLV